MATFPGGVFSPTTKSNGQVVDASHINDLQSEITAIEDGYRNATAPLNSSGSTLATLSVAGGSTFTGANFGDKAVYFTEHDNGNSGASKTIDWTLSPKQKVKMTAACTFTFTAPPGPTNLILKVSQDSTGNYAATWPSTATVIWTSSTAFVLSTAASARDLITFYYDGSLYWGQGAGTFG
jgi:hypothetical protein